MSDKLTKTPLSLLLDEGERRRIQVIRDLYIESMGYIASLTPNFQLNPISIAEHDQNNFWPANETRNGLRDLKWVSGLASYKLTPVNVSLVPQGIYLKFPSVSMDGRALSSWELYNWRRAYRNSIGQGYANHDWNPLLGFELGAFALDRVPTQAEFLTQLDWFRARPKVETNEFGLDLNKDIVEQLEKANLKYMASVRKIKTNQDSCNLSMYKSYLKYRGNSLLARYRVDYANQVKPKK